MAKKPKAQMNQGQKRCEHRTPWPCSSMATLQVSKNMRVAPGNPAAEAGGCAAACWISPQQMPPCHHGRSTLLLCRLPFASSFWWGSCRRRYRHGRQPVHVMAARGALAGR